MSSLGDQQPKPRLLMISHVLPFPGAAGQQQRVFYTLKALRDAFEVSFLTTAPTEKVADIRQKLLQHCHSAIVLPSRFGGNPIRRNWQRLIGEFYAQAKGLKFSNYLIGQIELPPQRVLGAIAGRQFDLALIEYWHATACVPGIQKLGIRCLLDLHDLLFQSFERQLREKTWPDWWKKRAVRLYRMQEERAWQVYDGLIAINRAEFEYIKERSKPSQRLFYAPMGTDLTVWPYSWEPADPPRIAYYGGLGSRHNQQAAWTCYQDIMPVVWERFPNAELWLVGSNPPPELKALPPKDPRVRVTGFIQDVQEILKTMSLVLCPWQGTYGFRSRLIEVMALGVPVLATYDAVHGMDLEPGQGIWLVNGSGEMTSEVVERLNSVNPSISQAARAQVERLYSYDATYTKLVNELTNWIQVSSGEI